WCPPRACAAPIERPSLHGRSRMRGSSAVVGLPSMVPGAGSLPGLPLSTARRVRRRGSCRLQRVINHNCFNSIKDFFPSACFSGGREMFCEVRELVEFFLIVAAGPERGGAWRACALRAAFACLVPIALDGPAARAQPITPDFFSPRRTTQIAPGNL